MTTYNNILETDVPCWASFVMDWEWPKWFRLIKRNKFHQRHRNIFLLELNLGIIKNAESCDLPEWIKDWYYDPGCY